jgi:hypothetical protein
MSHDVLRTDHHVVTGLHLFSSGETDGVLLDDLLDNCLGNLAFLRDGGQPPSRYYPGRRSGSREQKEAHILVGATECGRTYSSGRGAARFECQVYIHSASNHTHRHTTIIASYQCALPPTIILYPPRSDLNLSRNTTSWGRRRLGLNHKDYCYGDHKCRESNVMYITRMAVTCVL